MSQVRNNNSQRYNNSNVSGSFGRSGTSQSGPNRSGFVSLGGLPKRGRSGPGSSAAKLSIPKPVNLPSLRKENAGNDPLSQIVHGGGGGWQKPEPEQASPPPSERQSSLVGNSNWASRQPDGGSAFGQQPLIADSGYPGYGGRDRRLNPAEYPSLSAAAYAAQQQQTKQQQQQVASASQATGQWDEDERHGPTAPTSRLQDPQDWGSIAADDHDLNFGRRELQPPPAHERGYNYVASSYRPPAGPSYSLPNRSSDRFDDTRVAGDYGARHEYDYAPSYTNDSRDSRQYAERGPHDYSARYSQNGPSRDRYNDAAPRGYGDHRWNRGSEPLAARGNRSPSYADRQPPYTERPPPHADRPPSYADRPPSYASGRVPLAERPTRYEEPSYQPVPTAEYATLVDDALFPPPPPTGRGRRGDLIGQDGGTPKDLEREAFNAELDRLAADLDKERQRKREAPPPPPLVQASPDLSEDAAAAENTAAMAVAAGEVAAATAQVHAAVPGSEEHKSAEAAVAKAKMKFKPLVDEEEERRRASAAAKLRALDEAIAKRKAEEERRRSEEEAAAAVIAEAEAAQLAEEMAAAAALEAASRAAAEPTDEAEHEPLLPHEPSPDQATDTTPLLAGSTEAIPAEADGASLAAPSIEVEIASMAPVSLLNASSDQLEEEALPEDSPQAAAASEAPKAPVNAWAKPLTLPNGQTPSAWQAATAPTPAEAAHQASAQALGIIPGPSAGKRLQASPSEPLLDPTPDTWDEPVEHRGQQSWQGRQGRDPSGSDQAEWRRTPQLNEQGEFQSNGGLIDGMGAADRGRGRGRGRGRARHRDNLDFREGQPLQQMADGEAQFRGERPGQGRGRLARGRGGRGGRQRDFAKGEQEKFAAKAAADAAASQALGIAGPAAALQLGGSADPTAPPPPLNAPPQGGDQTHKRQQQPRVREQAAKRGRSKGPFSRPGSAASKVKQETEPQQAPLLPSDVDALSSVVPSAPLLPQSEPSASAAVQAVEPSSNASGWDSNNTAAEVVSSIAQLNLDTPVSLSPVLDPVARHPGAADGSLPDLRGFQIERPNSATKVTAVSRPKSANLVSNPFNAAKSDLPNGMPALPADLTFDAVLDKPAASLPHSQGGNVSLGHMQQPQPGQATDRLHSGAFPSALFPVNHQNNDRSAVMWQPPPPPPDQLHKPQPNLAAAVESFYAARAVGNSSSFGTSASAAFSGAPSSNPPLNLPQFGSFGAGTFGSGLQFGQLGGAFGQSPFIPTGKQPDWSTGPISGSGPSVPTPTQPAANTTNRPTDNLSSGLRNFNARSHPGPMNGAAPGQRPNQASMVMPGSAAANVAGSAGFSAPFDAAAGLPDDVFDEPKQRSFEPQHQPQQQQQRMPNGSYRGRSDPRRGRGRNDGPVFGRGYRGGRGGRGPPQGLQYAPLPMDAPANLGNANRQNDFSRPQRMSNDGIAQGQGQGQPQGRGMPYGRGNMRGGGSFRGRGSYNANNVQKAPVAKAAGHEAAAGSSAAAPTVG